MPSGEWRAVALHARQQRGSCRLPTLAWPTKRFARAEPCGGSFSGVACFAFSACATDSCLILPCPWLNHSRLYRNPPNCPPDNVAVSGLTSTHRLAGRTLLVALTLCVSRFTLYLSRATAPRVFCGASRLPFPTLRFTSYVLRATAPRAFCGPLRFTSYVLRFPSPSFCPLPRNALS
jgi:hypothetical protein